VVTAATAATAEQVLVATVELELVVPVAILMVVTAELAAILVPLLR
jgi:hypothetical protein